MLSIQNLSILKPQIICQNLNLELNVHNRLAIIGRNGVGKTTLIQNIIQLNNIYINKIPLKEKTKYIQNYVAYCSQKVDFYPYITPRQLFKFIRNKIDVEDIKTYLNIFNILTILDVELYKLSGGQRQLVFVLLTLMQNSAILILDEPLANLDWVNTQLLLQQLKQRSLKYNCYILTSTHDIANLEQHFTHVLYLQGNGAYNFSTSQKFNILV